MADDFEKECQAGMAKAIDYLKQELRGVRTGRASPGLVEHLKITVASYGSTMELRELASITAPEPSLLVVKPFDPATLKDIERGIATSDIGITPQSDGKTIRLAIPALSGERRKQMVQQVKKKAETQKIPIRNIRRDINKRIEAQKKEGTLTEDEADTLKDKIQKLTKQHEDQIDALTIAKTKEIEEQ